MARPARIFLAAELLLGTTYFVLPDSLVRAAVYRIYVTLALYPGVPREEVGFRIQVTAANTDDEVAELLAALDRLADVVPLRGI